MASPIEWYVDRDGDEWSLTDGVVVLRHDKFTEGRVRHLAGCTRMALLLRELSERYHKVLQGDRSRLTQQDAGKMDLVDQLRRAYESDDLTDFPGPVMDPC